MSIKEEWPAELDALVAAPRHHTLLLENEAVRVLQTRIPSRETVPLHTHCWPSVLYVVHWSDFVRRDADGAVMADSRLAKPLPTESAIWSGALPPHTLENVGPSELCVINVELKNGGSFSK